ncbi:MAG TPA: hypothetical protein VIY73_04230, partial [Polyangiaceae bacterium]
MTMTSDTIDTTQDQATERAVNDNAQQRPDNDNAHARGVADTTALVTHADFVSCVRRALVRFGRRKHLADDVPEVQMRALEAARLG